MPSIFRDIWSDAVQLLDQTFADMFSVTPMLRIPNGRPTPDASRQAWVIYAEFLDEADADFGTSPGHSNNSGQKVVAAKARVVVTLANLPYQIRIPDQMTRLDTGDVYEVSDVVTDGWGRATIHLTNAKMAA